MPPAPLSSGLAGGPRAAPTLTADGLTVVGGLGQGGYGVVVAVEHQGQRFAMKCVSKSRSAKAKDKKHLRRELRALTELPPSPFLMRSYLAFESVTTVFFVTDLIGGGDLFFHLDVVTLAGNDGFDEDMARILIGETAAGLCHMHDRNLIHRDIKVENVMLDAAGHVKLVDYGLCCEVNSEEGEPVSPVGSLIYMAPELLRESMGGRFTDWWALGVLSHELLTGRSPWSTLSDKKQIKKEIMGAPMEPPLRGMSLLASQLVTSLLRKDRTVRLGTHNSREVLGHAFFTSVMDMAALERGETPPALVPDIDTGAPGGNTTMGTEAEGLAADQAEALDEYRRISPTANNSGSQGEVWSMGLPQVRHHPACSPAGRR